MDMRLLAAFACILPSNSHLMLEIERRQCISATVVVVVVVEKLTGPQENLIGSIINGTARKERQHSLQARKQPIDECAATIVDDIRRLELRLHRIFTKYRNEVGESNVLKLVFCRACKHVLPEGTCELTIGDTVLITRPDVLEEAKEDKIFR